MRTWLGFLLLATAATMGCGGRHTASGEPQALTTAEAAAVENGVRSFAQVVAHDVTQEGPAAWRRHFADTPSFFMAVNGRLAFSDSASTTAGIQDAVRAFRQIDLKWGDDLRVDPVAPGLAMMAATYHEIQVAAAGSRVEDNGFFTGLAEYRSGRWQFRNAHWSSMAAPGPVR
jgi:hypothetical protein